MTVIKKLYIGVGALVILTGLFLYSSYTIVGNAQFKSEHKIVVYQDPQ